MSHERIIHIAGVPRSGTSWLGQLMDSSPDTRFLYQPLFAYAFKNVLQFDSSPEAYRQFFRDLYAYDHEKDDFIYQRDKRERGSYPVFEKKAKPGTLALKEVRYHYLIPKMLRHCPELQAVCIVRHPCGAIQSWLSAPREFPPEADRLKEWRTGAVKNQGREEDFYGYYKWKEAAHLFLDLADREPNRVKIVRYEDLVAQTQDVTREIFEFCGLDYTDQTQKFVEQCHASHSDDIYGVYKSPEVAGKWRERLEPSIIEEIELDLKGTRLEQFIR